MEAVLKKSAELQATEILRDQILRGKLKPGSRLTEMKLAERLKVSRATVRVALHQLAVEGLVVQVPYTGWSVMTLTPRDAWELYTLRASLEGLAARLASRSLDTSGRHDLTKAFERLCEASRSRSLSAVTGADFDLHKTIVRLAAHRRLAEQYRLVEQQIRTSIGSTNALLQDVFVIIEQHRPIVDAIVNGRAEEAARCSEAHNVGEGERLHAFLLQQEQQGSDPSAP